VPAGPGIVREVAVSESPAQRRPCAHHGLKHQPGVACRAAWIERRQSPGHGRNGSILAIAILTLVATAIGFVCGAPRLESSRVLALGTSQRNMAACFIIANANFSDRPEDGPVATMAR